MCIGRLFRYRLSIPQLEERVARLSALGELVIPINGSHREIVGNC